MLAEATALFKVVVEFTKINGISHKIATKSINTVTQQIN